MKSSSSRARAGGIAGLLVGTLMAALLSSGCGPTQSTALIMDAEVQLAAARTADAPKLAPFEFTAAEAYLKKAKEEQGYADYEVCIDFAQKALKFASDAKTKAMNAKADGLVPSAPTPATATNLETR